MQLLTKERLDWEKKYVEGKLHLRKISTLKRLFTIAENMIDSRIRPRTIESTYEIIQCAEHLVDFTGLGKNALVVGCGPKPEAIAAMSENGYLVRGIEPVPGSVEEANRYLAGRGDVIAGTAEKIMVPDESTSLVIMENVLEHVDSVKKSLAEAYRVLKFGGVLYVRTTNRQRFSLTGINWEFTARYYNFFPKLVKESYVFLQQNYKPEIANYSPRPAVHWFSYAELCDKGREEGFARFYSPFDLLHRIKLDSRPNIKRFGGVLRKNPWLRALAISQLPCDIFMWKRR
jgi:ubiquinone/menaquinone biosynthesis C-methylase UbiE